eukprot:11901309-Prorocentrum_lima.AAC.1
MDGAARGPQSPIDQRRSSKRKLAGGVVDSNHLEELRLASSKRLARPRDIPPAVWWANSGPKRQCLL